MTRRDARSEKLKLVFQGGKRFEYQKGTTILRARETPRGAYFIESGLLKMYSLSRQGDEHVLDFLGPGDLFPILWPFRRTVRSMYYEALAPTTLRMIPREDFSDLMAGQPRIMSEVLEMLVDRYHLYVGRIDNLLYSDALERSAYRLLALANRFGVRTDDGIVIDALITHEDLAHSISTTRETFGRSMTRLQRRGLIGYDSQRHVVIKDLSKLSGIIGRDESAAMWPELMKYAI
jgi:CRP-like cAMP-binding protein